MVQVTAAIGQFFVLLLESMAWAGLAIAGYAAMGLAAAGGVALGVRKVRRTRRG